MTSAPPNWYPDPQVPGQMRYWDGHQWTAHVAPGQPQAKLDRDGDGEGCAGD